MSEEVKKVVGRAVRANYSPIFTNSRLQEMAKALSYMLEYIKINPDGNKNYMLKYISAEANKDIGKLISSWKGLPTEFDLASNSSYHSVVKLNKEASIEITKARRRAAAAKKAKITKNVVMPDDIPF